MKLCLPKSPQHMRILALLAILLFACGLILWHALNQYHTTEQEKYTLVKTALDGTAQELTTHLQDMRRSIQILIENRRQEIRRLLDSPLDQSQFDKLFSSIKHVYPNLFGLMLADSNGALLLEDFRGILDKAAREDLRNFARTGVQPPLRIHHHPLGNHYYVLTRIPTYNRQFVILYLSFTPDNIQQLLQSNQLHNYRVLILHNNKEGLVEVDPAQQASTNPQAYLAEDVRQQISYHVPIAGTQWELAALQTRKAILAPTWTTALWAFSMLLFLGSTALWLMRRSDMFVLQQSNILQKEQRRLNHLQQTTISSELSFHEKIRSLLVMGLDEFGMEVAILSQVDANHYTIVSAVSPDNSLQPGMGFALNNTYCRHTLKRGQPVGIEQTNTKLGMDHPYYRKQRIQA
jgi:hypothetical protein